MSLRPSLRLLSAAKPASLPPGPSGRPPAVAPPTLLIYNQGIPRNAFAGLLRASSVVYVSWSLVSAITATAATFSAAPLSILSILPTVPVALYSAFIGGFACTIHLELPVQVRSNNRRYTAVIAGLRAIGDQDAIQRDLAIHPSLSPSQHSQAEAKAALRQSILHIRTPRLLGHSRLSSVPFSRLRLRAEPAGLRALLPSMNLESDIIGTELAPNLASAVSKPRKRFFVVPGNDQSVQTHSLAPGIWPAIWNSLNQKR